MKANRKFVEGEEAVSAVIGVILMVAITVAIAATVYVYVSGMLGGPGTSTPTVGASYNKETMVFQLGTPTESDIAWTSVSCKLVNTSGNTVHWIGTADITEGGSYLAAGDTINIGNLASSVAVAAGYAYTFTLLYNTTGGSMYTYSWTQT